MLFCALRIEVHDELPSGVVVLRVAISFPLSSVFPSLRKLPDAQAFKNLSQQKPFNGSH